MRIIITIIAIILIIIPRTGPEESGLRRQDCDRFLQ